MKKILLISLVLAVLSCTSETYDSGDGSLSFLRADFVEMHTAAAKEVDRFVTDEGEAFSLSRHASVGWAEKADTLYRALAYYNKVGEQAEPRTFQQVYVLRPQTAEDDDDELRHDPVGLESTWMSPNGKYINMGLLLKMGQTDDTELRQVIGVSIDDDTEQAMTLTFVHDQGGVPEYYTQRLYVSIPVSENMQGKDLTLNIQTYEGLVTKNFHP